MLDHTKQCNIRIFLQIMARRALLSWPCVQQWWRWSWRKSTKSNNKCALCVNRIGDASITINAYAEQQAQKSMHPLSKNTWPQSWCTDTRHGLGTSTHQCVTTGPFTLLRVRKCNKRGWRKQTTSWTFDNTGQRVEACTSCLPLSSLVTLFQP